MDLERHDPGPVPGIRASDAERDRVVGLLKQHFTDGRLTLEEFSERMDVAYAAKTRGELVTTLRELPVLARGYADPRAVDPGGQTNGRGYWPFPVPLIPIALILLVLAVAIATRGVFLWPLLIFLWIWGGHNARYRRRYPHEWEHRGGQRYRMF